jgi:predicted peptidase
VASLVYTPSPWTPPSNAPLQDRFVEECVEVDGDTWWFRVWLPPDLQAVRKEQAGLPAFLLLHGFKECGWDNWWQTQAGLALLLQEQETWARWFPGILVLPQLPRRPWDEKWWQHWREPNMQKMALACLEKACAKYGADRKRLYLLGESLGTEGAWYLAASRPGFFTAVGGACGSVEPYNWESWEWGSAPEEYRQLARGIGRDTPMWFCHGTKDDFVPVEQSRRFLAALEESRASTLSAVGAIIGRSEAAEASFREYEDLDHHVWDRAYWDDGLIQWLLSHKKP